MWNFNIKKLNQEILFEEIVFLTASINPEIKQEIWNMILPKNPTLLYLPIWYEITKFKMSTIFFLKFKKYLENKKIVFIFSQNIKENKIIIPKWKLKLLWKKISNDKNFNNVFFKEDIEKIDFGKVLNYKIIEKIWMWLILLNKEINTMFIWNNTDDSFLEQTLKTLIENKYKLFFFENTKIKINDKNNIQNKMLNLFEKLSKKKWKTIYDLSLISNKQKTLHLIS